MAWRRRNVRKRKAGKRNAKRSASKRLATVAQVKRMIAGKEERKLIGVNDSQSYNQYISTPGDLVPLLPPLAVGVADTERVGNKVNAKYLKVSMTLSMNADSARPGDVILPRIFVVSNKDQRDMAALISNGGPQSYLLDGGYGAHGFAGNQGDYRCPINTNQFTVHKDIKTELSLNSVESNGIYQKTFNFTVKCPKVLLYNDSQNYPRNFAPFFYASYAQANGVVGTTLETKLRVDWTTTLYYTDS